MVAFHYPPNAGSSGVHRTVKFSCYLRSGGWQPIILSAHPRSYPETSGGELSSLPSDMVVVRAFAVDARRHLAIRGSSLGVLGIPDRWISWWLGAIPAGLRLIRRYRPAVIWSTYPIATASLIALSLHRLTGIPWVADFRDPMIDREYPAHARTRRIHQWIEARAAASAARLVFTTPSARRDFLDRHPGVPPSRGLVIPNGYDEADFASLLEAAPGVSPPGHQVRMVHAGFVYQAERDPRPLLRALARLRKDGRLDPGSLRIDLRAPGTPDYYADLIQTLDLQDLVFILPALSYRDALQDSAAADALLLLQGAACNHQIPAKAYEYLRLRRPILALTPAESDTAALLDECGGATRMDLLDEDALHAQLPTFLESVRRGTHPLPAIERVARYTRHAQARDLAVCLDAVARS
jgi:glycosyltransferase involved in cell wall biosynthesis